MTKLLFVLLVTLALSLKIEEKSVKGTERLSRKLTDKQLGIQRLFSYLTILQTARSPNNETIFGWKLWESNINNEQLGLQSARYPLAFIGYLQGAHAYKTPAYRELSIKTLDNIIQRMIEKQIWKYIEKYWSKHPSFPDPVSHENIMYSGHLGQLISLYESLSGDFKYSTKGWDFVWERRSKIIHYNTTKLLDAMRKQTYLDYDAGIPCEPHGVFVICQDHPHNAFILYDHVHKTNYAQCTPKWKDFLYKTGLVTLPYFRNFLYLKIIYHHATKIWLPLGTAGNDGWALAWMTPWNNDNQFICKGGEVMRNSTRWTRDPNGGEYLDAGALGGHLQMNTYLSTSMFTIVDRQCSNTHSFRYDAAMAWFERSFGKLIDTDGDGNADSYIYSLKDDDFSIWSTANLLTGMIMEKDDIRKMYRSNFHEERKNEPVITNVDYPKAMISEAYYEPTRRTLVWTILSSNDQYLKTKFKIENVKSIRSFLKNGQIVPPSEYHYDDDKKVVEVECVIEKDTRLQYVLSD